MRFCVSVFFVYRIYNKVHSQEMFMAGELFSNTKYVTPNNLLVLFEKF